MIVAILVGGGGWFVWWDNGAWGPGLIAVLVLIAGVALLFTTRYPRGIFDFVLGLDRWVFRVAAYAGLMTTATRPSGSTRRRRCRLRRGSSSLRPFPRRPFPRPRCPRGSGRRQDRRHRRRQHPGADLPGLLAGGIGGIVVDQTQRNADGFLMSPSEDFDTGTYALVSETLDVGAEVPQWVIDELIGTVRIESESERPVFVGIAEESDADTYLGDVRRAVVTDVGSDPDYSIRRGGHPPPRQEDRPSGWRRRRAGEQVLDWDVEDGDWVIVAMNADGSAGVTVELRIGAEVDPLIWIALGLLLSGVLVGLGAAALIYVGSRRRAEPRARGVCRRRPRVARAPDADRLRGRSDGREAEAAAVLEKPRQPFGPRAPTPGSARREALSARVLVESDVPTSTIIASASSAVVSSSSAQPRTNTTVSMPLGFPILGRIKRLFPCVHRAAGNEFRPRARTPSPLPTAFARSAARMRSSAY